MPGCRASRLPAWGLASGSGVPAQSGGGKHALWGKRSEHSSDGVGEYVSAFSQQENYTWNGSTDTDIDVLDEAIKEMSQWDLCEVIEQEQKNKQKKKVWLCSLSLNSEIPFPKKKALSNTHQKSCFTFHLTWSWSHHTRLSLSEADKLNTGGATCSSADVADICRLPITVWNFTRLEWSVFAHVFVCVHRMVYVCVFFAEGGTRFVTHQDTDSVNAFALVAASGAWEGILQ